MNGSIPKGGDPQAKKLCADTRQIFIAAHLDDLKDRKVNTNEKTQDTSRSFAFADNHFYQ